MAKQKASKTDRAGTVSGDSFVLPTWVHENLPQIAKAARIPAKVLRAEVDRQVEVALGQAIDAVRDDVNAVAIAKRLRAATDEALEALAG